MSPPLAPVIFKYPDIVPVVSPVKVVASIVAASNVSVPILHLSSVSFQTNCLLASSPRSISIPPDSVGPAPVKLLFNNIILSAILTSSVLTVVVVPCTVKFPCTITSFSNVAVPVTLGVIILPDTPSIIGVLSSATTLPISEPSNTPVCKLTHAPL